MEIFETAANLSSTLLRLGQWRATYLFEKKSSTCVPMWSHQATA